MQRLRGAREQLVAVGDFSIGLLGSFVTGRQTATSDGDFLVDFAPGQHSFDNFGKAGAGDGWVLRLPVITGVSRK